MLVLLLTPAFFSIGPLSMSPARLVFLVTMPVMLVQLLRGAYGRILLTDILILCFIGWMGLAIVANHPPRVALEFIGASAVTLLGAYLTGRSGIRCKADYVAMVRFLALVVVVSFPFVIYEVLTSDPIILTLLRQIPGITTNPNVNHDPRLGLWRAQFVFPHPIHYGLFCAMVFSLVYVGLEHVMPRFRRWVTSAIIGLLLLPLGVERSVPGARGADRADRLVAADRQLHQPLAAARRQPVRGLPGARARLDPSGDLRDRRPAVLLDQHRLFAAVAVRIRHGADPADADLRQRLQPLPDAAVDDRQHRQLLADAGDRPRGPGLPLLCRRLPECDDPDRAAELRP